MNPTQFNFLTSVGTRAFNDLVAYNIVFWRFGIGIGVLLVIAALWSFSFYPKMKKSEEYETRNAAWISIVIGLLCLAVAVLALILNGIDLANPEAATISNLTSRN